MSTDRQHNNLIFQCDTCNEVFETEDSEWAIAWTAAKDEGWRAVKKGGGWNHKCPGCADD